ncbi:glucosaminidase domain-containing protein [Vibrio rumoiensis]|uniref:Glucosaminidase domain-containing protein n=1 Tax=Vibrio rumoiensis TaxID=76258 RepID=A0ABW7IZ90_9VIBR|nr:glucosaminidase domain-containing protein [Vibrio rumoiensis]
MKKKIIMALAILAFWSVYYYQNHYNQHSKEEATKVKPKAPMPVDDIHLKKQKFFDTLRPGIKKENARVVEERHELLDIKKQFDDGDLTSIPSKAKQLAEDYELAIPETGIDDAWLDTMLNRVNVLPQSLVLTQAANESAWGTSRFAKEGNNFFGQWCYVEGCGLVPLQRAEGATHEVAKFDSPQESIHAYFMNVNRNNAYKELRDIRAKLSGNEQDLKSQATALELTNGLLSYSERGQDYVDDLQAMIKHNAEFWTDK